MPLPFSRRASQTAPSFSRDFAGLKALDHGVGPAITFTRASNATFFDANGTLQTAANDTPRFDHDPATAGNPSRGLLIEEARTNSIRNAQAGGSTNGVIGSGGVMPTNWGTGTVSGISYEVIGTGTVGGFSYLDLKISGTNSSGSTVLPIFSFEATSVIVASSGQSWTGSLYIALQAGSLAGASSFNIDVAERDSGGAFLVASATGFTPTSALTRISHSRTLSNASTARTNHRVYFSVANGDSIDLTLRIAAPQLEQGAFPTSYIPTTTAAATRSADSAVVTPISSFYNQAEGTLFAEFTPRTLTVDTVPRTALNFDDNSLTNQNVIGQNATNDSVYFNGFATSTQWTIAGGSSIVGANMRVAGAYAANDAQAAINGTLGTADASLAIPTVTHLRVGRRASNGHLSGHIRKISYWPRRLSNTLLQQLTT